MPKVKVLRPHTVGGIIRKRGEVYDENDRLTKEKVRAGLVELSEVRAKVDRDMYTPRSYEVETVEVEAEVVDDELRIIGRTGNWYFFSDGEKALGKKAAAEKLGVEELPDVDFDDD